MLTVALGRSALGCLGRVRMVNPALWEEIQDRMGEWVVVLVTSDVCFEYNQKPGPSTPSDWGHFTLCCPVSN